MKFCRYLALAFGFLVGGIARADLRIADHYLVFDSDAPPAMMVVIDSTGATAGVNLARSVNSIGAGRAVSQIAGSYVEQMNIAADGTGQPQPSTSWTVYVQDQPAQSYAVNLFGTESGAAFLNIGGGYKSKRKNRIPIWSRSFLMGLGVSRTVKVNYDPIAGALTITPLINTGDFFRDTQSACSLKDIAPASACDVLESLASSVEKAISKGDSKIESAELDLYLQILDRLRNWGQKDARHNWDDFKEHSECDGLRNDRKGGEFYAKDPSYSALKLDVETLLDALKKDDGHDKDRSRQK